MKENLILMARGVSREYGGRGNRYTAVRSVSLDVERGEFVAIMGRSGCGKSTLLHLIGGIERPTDGEVEIAGTPLTGLGERALAKVRRRHIGIVFQFFNLINNLSAADNIDLPALVAGKPKAEVKRRREELLTALEIPDIGRQLPSQLSGGQRQRVAIARALINEPTLLLADEPTGALDQSSGESVLALLRQVNRQSGQTIILVTHDPKIGAQADRLLQMRDGQIVSESRPDPAAADLLANRLLGIGEAQ